jgi:hypothetical protein
LSDELLTIHDLADRWGVSIDKAKKHVRMNRIPFLQIGTSADMRTNWSTIRFRAGDVTRWEQESTNVFPESEQPKAPAVVVGKRHKHTRIK